MAEAAQRSALMLGCMVLHLDLSREEREAQQDQSTLWDQAPLPHP